MFKRSISLVIVLALIFSVTPINHQNVSATRLSYQNIDSINQPANTANIGEVFAERAGFGFVRHELNVLSFPPQYGHSIPIAEFAENPELKCFTQNE